MQLTTLNIVVEKAKVKLSIPGIEVNNSMYSVMIVEDEKPARELIKMRFDWNESPFYICHEALNGYEALEYYKNEMQPDIIITDIEMPRMNGIDLIIEIQRINKNQIFIILSCHESFQYAKKAIRLGARDYLIKDNVTSEDLYTVLLQSVNHLRSNVLPDNTDTADCNAASETLYQILNNKADYKVLNLFFDSFDCGKEKKGYFIMFISIENINGLISVLPQKN